MKLEEKLKKMEYELKDLKTRYKKLLFKKPRPIASLASYGNLIEMKISQVAVLKQRVKKRKKYKPRKTQQKKRGKKYF